MMEEIICSCACESSFLRGESGVSIEQTVEGRFGQTSSRTLCLDPALANLLVETESSFTCVECASEEQEEEEEEDQEDNDEEGGYDDQSPFFENGINGLFAGHSFFQPIAESFDAIVRGENFITRGGDDVAFPNHQFDSVFASGASGLPGNLWENENTKRKIENKLKTGTVGLFGMNTATFAGSPPGGIPLDDYTNWIDLALMYNDQTSFLIGHPFLPNGPGADAEFYKTASETSSAGSFSVIQELRMQYPSTKIFFIDYGYTAAIMKEMFESNTLPDIESMTPEGRGTRQTSLFTDSLGHAGPMLEDMCALTWMNILYGVDYAAVQQPMDYETSSVMDIVTQVMEFNVGNEYN